VVNTALGVGFGIGASFNPLVASLYALPLKAGVLLFRAGASESKLRFVVEHSSDVALLVGPDRRVRYIAPSSETGRLWRRSPG
jgi:hypothetical protein